MGRLRYARVRYLLAVLLPALAQAQTNCNQAPTPAMRTVCMQLNEWDDSARTQPASSPMGFVAAPGVAGMVSVMSVLPATVTDPASCNDIGCICGLVGGQMSGSSCSLQSGGVYGKGVRKEYRMMTDDERDRFHAAMWTLKRNGDYDRLAHIHANVNQAPSAHSGPSFLPWHREYVKRFEIALRLIDPTISVPYWDTTLEGALADPKYSVLWSDELMGAVMSGPVNSGVFRGWTGMTGATIVRNLGADSGRVLNMNDRNAALGKTRIESVMAFTSTRSGCPYSVEWDNLEFAHGYSHVYVGGEMFQQHTAAFDPLFFLYHSFIDSMWEDWRNQRQNRNTRPTAYPPNNDQCSSTAHFSTSPMSPFAPLQNIDGCSNDYTDNLYTYDTRRPSCALGENCGSKYLFCDRSHGAPQCSAKIRPGQPCTGYSRGEDMCYNSVCTRGVCSTVSPTSPTTPPPIRTVPTPPPTESCFNEHECCAPWAARGECNRNAGYMRTWCQSSCNICTPRLYVPSTECSDRHASCRSWAAGGECTNNPLWMTENCRQSCNRCGRTREQTCFPPNVVVTTMAPVTWWTRRWNTRRPITQRPPQPWWFTTPRPWRPWWLNPRRDGDEEDRRPMQQHQPRASEASRGSGAAKTSTAARTVARRQPMPQPAKGAESRAAVTNKRTLRKPDPATKGANAHASRGASKKTPPTKSKGSGIAREETDSYPVPQKAFNETGPYPPHPRLLGTRVERARPKQRKSAEKKKGSGLARQQG